MRMSRLFLETTKEVPADAEIPSHQLMVRAGLIKKHSAGLYSFTPLLYRTIKKISDIVSQEMDRAGAQQVLMPILQPAELWQESRRWDHYQASKIMFTLTDRKESALCLGPTHEEMIVDLVRKTIRSYRQLPVTLYQQHTKFRDEIRPRFGLMRCREFIMKDAYSFDEDEASLDKSYTAMSEAYERIFNRCGLNFVKVEADSGAIGGSGSQEFMVTAESGEDEIIICNACHYGANVEKADSVPPQAETGGGEKMPLEQHDTPMIKTVEQLSDFFNIEPSRMIKTIIYRVVTREETKFAAVLMRGDLDVNEVKVANRFDALSVELASDDEIQALTGAPTGFAGPMGLDRNKISVLADNSTKEMSNFLCGCNKKDVHCLNVNWPDCGVVTYGDFRTARAGAGCVRCGAPLSVIRGIEVGHVFKLGTKYSEKMKALFTDRDGKERPFVMGCYGIGTSRVAAAAIEQYHDENGMIWPATIAPYHAVIIPVNIADDTQWQAALKLYTDFTAAGIETLLDDREARAGVKFKDADLIGLPFIVIVGRDIGEGKVEFKTRKTGEKKLVPVADILQNISSFLADQLA